MTVLLSTSELQLQQKWKREEPDCSINAQMMEMQLSSSPPLLYEAVCQILFQNKSNKSTSNCNSLHTRLFPSEVQSLTNYSPESVPSEHKLLFGSNSSIASSTSSASSSTSTTSSLYCPKRVKKRVRIAEEYNRLYWY